ncbi:uncharacterized protein HaLaN_25483, partial [Haematococcus lacustris]
MHAMIWPSSIVRHCPSLNAICRDASYVIHDTHGPCTQARHAAEQHRDPVLVSVQPEPLIGPAWLEVLGTVASGIPAGDVVAGIDEALHLLLVTAIRQRWSQCSHVWLEAEPQLPKFAQRLDSGENGGAQAMWTTALHEAICGRDAMPNIEQQQQLYVRYGNQPEASAGNWQAAASRVNRSFSSLRAHEPSALESVMMSVKEAPAEFAVPVKQDRRLSPSFKVEVNIHHQGPLALPFTLKACLITQQDMDNILLWAPEDLATEDKANKMTELKGNTTITHYFASNCGASSLAARSLSSPYPADTSAPPASSCNALSMPA